jgi:acyl-CoA thioesterase-1
VPLLVRWPGVVPAGRVSRQPVTSVDYFPTITEAAGVAPPAGRTLDGVSLLAHLRSGGREPLARDALFWHFPHYRGGGDGRVTPYGIVRAGRWKLIERYEGPTHELYDLERDLAESEDLAGREPARVEELAARLRRHLADTGARLPRPNPAYTAAPPERPRVLILGDSISIGYTGLVRELLAGEALVVRPMREAQRAENCEGTTAGVEQLERWLALEGGDWDVIHFNFGLHDLKRVDPGTGRPSNDPAHPRQAEPWRYERQLRAIVERLRRSGAKLVFATTTPVPEGDVRPHRDVADAARYNAIATRVMREHGIAVNDLHAFAAARLEEIQQPVNVHFTEEGSGALAGEVAEAIRRALAAE